jgi:hypothetical protein
MQATGAPGAALRAAKGIPDLPDHLRSAVGTHFLDLAVGVERESLRMVADRAKHLAGPARDGMDSLFAAYEALGTRSSLLGLPLMVAYDLNVRDWSNLVRVYEATLLGCLHAVGLDAIVDTHLGSEAGPLQDLYLVHILFDWYVDSLSKISASSWVPTGASLFQATEQETYEALYEEEFLHVRKSTPYKDGRIQTAKCSALKVVLASVVSAGENPECLRSLSHAVDRTSYAMCLLDDVWDWEEDLARHRYTLPIQRALEALRISDQEREFANLKHRVRRSLFLNGIVEGLVRDISLALRESRDEVRSISPKAELWLWLAERSARSYWTTTESVLKKLLAE